MDTNTLESSPNIRDYAAIWRHGRTTGFGSRWSRGLRLVWVVWVSKHRKGDEDKYIGYWPRRTQIDRGIDR